MATCKFNYFLFIVLFIPSCEYISLLIQSRGDGYLDCFQFFTTINNAGFRDSSVVESSCNAGDATDAVRSLGWEDPLEKEMTTHSSIFAWEVPCTEERGRLQSMGCKELDVTERLSKQASINNAATNQLNYISLMTCVKYFLEYIPRSAIAGL